MKSSTPKYLLSQVAERLLWLDGHPFSLENYPMWRAAYNGRFRAMMFMCARQVAKSTSGANFIIAESIAYPFFREYYISPTKEQTLIFSNTRLGKVLAYSPLIKKFFQSPEHADRVLHRSYTNGSENFFSYACDDADRTRGPSADRVFYDEFQDMLYEAVVPVVNECMSNSDYRFETYAGTPKTMEASIQYLWDRSTQSEWVMKCDGCGTYNFVASEKSLGKLGPICLKCGHYLNPRKGQWMDMKDPDPDPNIRQIKGFHISRPIMPLDVPCACPPDLSSQEKATERWRDILNKMSVYSPAKFRNEVLGVSDAIGTRLISLEELEALCTGTVISPAPTTENTRDVSVTLAGVDWSGGGTTGVSRTALWIWGWMPAHQKLRTLYYHIYPGNNPVQDVDSVASICHGYNVAMLVRDAGGGALANATLRERLGMHRVFQVQYGNQAMPWKWNGVDRYLVDRTAMIDNFVMLLKRQGVILPPKEQVREPIKDILNEYEEVTTAGKKVWRHSPSLPDDSLHAMLFGWLAFKIVLGDFKFYA
jgi:Phage terminase large subunit (GpA)